MTTNRKPRVPSYRLHKPSGQAVVTLDGHDHYLGKFGSDPSKVEYERLVLLYLAHGRRMPGELLDRLDGPGPEGAPAGYSIATLCDEFLDWAESEYRRPDGSLSREVANVKTALRPLLRLFAGLPAAAFGPRALIEYRETQIDAGLSRGVINQRVGIVRRAFKWAAREEKIPAGVFHGLTTVDGLKRGRCRARETDAVQCVPQEHVDAALPHMPPPVRAMVELQLLTGARPGELVILRPCDIEMDGKVWLYRPEHHKNSWRGHERIIPLGPQSQDILRPLLPTGNQGNYLFSPTKAEIARRKRLRAGRKTPLWPSHVAAQKRKREQTAKQVLRDRYDVTTYSQAIRRACTKAKAPTWSPGRLRHNAATTTHKDLGIEAAKVLLGHKLIETTQIYSDANFALALEVAAKVG